MKQNPPKSSPRGFSLFELVIVIAVSGILAGVAIAAISKLNDTARLSSAKRNAQEAASLSAVAEAAGIVHVIPEMAGGIEATLAFLSNGISTQSDTGIPIDLRLPLSDDDISEAAQFLKLRYTTTGIIMEYNGH